MNLKDFPVCLSVKEANTEPVRGVVQGDVNTNRLRLTLLDGAGPFDFTGYSVILFSVLKPDGHFYVDSEGASVTVVDAAAGRLDIVLGEQAVTCAGVCLANIKIYAGDVHLTSAKFRYEVGRNLLRAAEIPTSDTEYVALQNLIAQVSKMIASEIVRRGSADVAYLRRDANGLLETSEDGEHYTVVGSAGHIILDRYGAELPQRPRLRFISSIVKDVDGVTTVIDNDFVTHEEMDGRFAGLRHAFHAQERDPEKEHYGVEAAASVHIALDAIPYSSAAEVGIPFEGQTYDAWNMRTQDKNAPDGTLIIKKMEE